jgi:hypothetical protein
MNQLHRLRRQALIPALSAAVILFAAAAGTAAAATAQQSTSQNWAGYVVQSKTGQSFSHVTGSWTVPSVSSDASDGSAAFWVGLGGSSSNSQALEQVGTGSDVSNGQVTYYAWSEIVPDPMHKLNLTVKPGDKITATVNVSGTSVTLTLADQSTGQSQTKTATVSNPDTSSAEWIAEAPSAAYSDGSTQVVSLADFGKVNFTGASATAGGTAGSLNDSRWNLNDVSLSGDGGGTMFHGGSIGGGGVAVADDGAGSDAAPGTISSDGSSFTVADGATASETSTAAGDPGTTADGSGDGYPGYSTGGGSGYGGSGYGDSGYGDSGYGDSGYSVGGSGYPGYGSAGSGYDSGGGYGYGDGYGGYAGGWIG